MTIKKMINQSKASNLIKRALHTVPVLVLIASIIATPLLMNQRAEALANPAKFVDGSSTAGVVGPYKWFYLFDENIQCQAYIAHDDKYAERALDETGLGVDYASSSGEVGETVLRIQESGVGNDSGQQTYIYFDSENSSTKDKCKKLNIFFILPGEDPTTLYGVGRQSARVIKLGGTAAAPKILSVKNQDNSEPKDSYGNSAPGPDGSDNTTKPSIALDYEANSKDFVKNLVYPNGQPSPPPGGGDGSIGGGNPDPCAFGNQVPVGVYENCLYPRFISFNAILWRNETYTLFKWAGSGQDLESNGMRYYLTKANGTTHVANNVWNQAGGSTPEPDGNYPWIQLNVDNTDSSPDSSLSLNLDGTGKDEVNGFMYYLNLIAQQQLTSRPDNQVDSDNPKNSFHLHYEDKGRDGSDVAVPDNSAPGVVDANTITVRNLHNILIIAGYNAEAKAVKFAANNPGGNEMKLMATYGQTHPTIAASAVEPKTYYASGSMISGCETVPAKIVFDSDPTSLTTSSSAVWATLWEPSGSNCTYENGDHNNGNTIKRMDGGRIRVIGVTKDAFDGYIGDQGAAQNADATSNLPFSCTTSLLEPLTWIMCPVINGARKVVDALDAQINNALTIDVGNGSSFDENDSNGRGGAQLYKAWSTVRYLALSLLVVIALVMVISQAISYGPFDAYTVKKILPRILVAVVGVSLSWQISKYLILLSDHVGSGIGSLLLTPFKGFGKVNLGGDSAATLSLGAIGLGAGLIGLGLLGIASLALVACLAVITAFFIITFRMILAMALVIFAPLAIVFWILPNTQKGWKLWKESFGAVLLVFPIIVVFITMGRIFAAIAGRNTGLFNQLIMFIAYFGPYFALPAAFRLAGGAIATIGGMANDRSKGIFDRQKKFRTENKAHRKEQRQSGNFFKGAKEGSFRAGLNRGFENAHILSSGQAGFNPRQLGSRMRTAAFQGSESEIKKFMESDSFAQWKGDDAKLWAAKKDSREDIEAELERFDPGRFAGSQNARAREDAVNQIMRTKREVNNETFQKARLRAQAGTGTGYEFKDPVTGQKRFRADLMMKDITDTYGNDANGAGKALAEMRGALSNSGQIAGQAGFGTWASAMSDYQSGNITAEQAHNAVMDNAADSVTPGQAMFGKPTSARELAAAHNRKLRDMSHALKTGGLYQGKAVTNRDFEQALASTAGLYDAMATSAAPQNAREFADGLLGDQIEDIDGSGPDTVLKLVQKRAGIPGHEDFEQMRRDYGSAATAAAASARGAGMIAPAGVMPGGPGTGLPTAGGQPNASDIRLKKDIAYLKTNEQGIRLYSFRYIWSEKLFVGVMAQEILNSHPKAVHKDAFGFYYVDYEFIGVDFMTFAEWQLKSRISAK